MEQPDCSRASSQTWPFGSPISCLPGLVPRVGTLRALSRERLDKSNRILAKTDTPESNWEDWEDKGVQRDKIKALNEETSRFAHSKRELEGIAGPTRPRHSPPLLGADGDLIQSTVLPMLDVAYKNMAKIAGPP